MPFLSDDQLAIVLAIVLWILVSLGSLIITVFVKRLLQTSIICVMLSGATLVTCYSLGATTTLLAMAFLSTTVLIFIGFWGLFLAGSHNHFVVNKADTDLITPEPLSPLPADLPRDLLMPFLFDGTLCGIYIFDVAAKKNIYINSQYSTITGYSLDDLNQLQEKSGIMNFFHPDDVEGVERHISEVLSSESNHYVDHKYRFRRQDGGWVHCLSRDVLMTSPSSNAKFMIGTFVDVSQLHKERAELGKLNARYSATFEDAPVGVAHVSLKGKFLRANRTLKNLLGYSDMELANLTFMDITHPDDLRKDLDLLESLIEGDIPRYKMDKRYFNAKNQVIWIELTVAAVRHANGDVDYFISIIRDITHDRLIARELKETNAAFTRFVNSSPFLLEQPISAIGAMAARIENKLVQRQIEEELLLVNDIAAISKSSDELTNRLNNLLDLVRFNPSSMTVDNESLANIVKLSRSQAALSPSYPKCRVSCDQSAVIPVDRTSFVTLIGHLCMNIEQMRTLADTQLMDVKIACYPEDWHQRVVLEFQCSGFELTPEFEQLMLRAYDYQDENQLDEVGLRFAIIRQIVRAHSGQLEVDCHASAGFTMTIALPSGSVLPD